jgi:hypothetical protein
MMNAVSTRRWGNSIIAAIFPIVALFALGRTVPEQEENLPQGARNSTISTTAASTMPRVIVIGFVGGFIRHDDPVHSEVQLAARLRKAYPSTVDVETFENYHEENARKKILGLLDTDHDGTLIPSEKQNSRIILYGHSWGASAAIELARELGKDGIPVLLTIQVDSVTKIHQNDAVIPANVARAVNFYQPDGFVHGQSAIRAADPARTKIIGNFQFDYKTVPYTCYEYPWYDRVFFKPHTQIECDPMIWERVESLIGAYLPQETSRGPE